MEAQELVEEVEPATQDVLITHQKIRENHAYEIIEMKPGFAKVRFLTKLAEKIDDTAYIYEASVFSCANFCAIAAINERMSHLISAKVDFLNPIKIDDEEIVFEATATTNSSGKKQIDVVGFVKGILVFESSFVTLKLDKKSLLKEIEKEKN